MLLSNYLRRNEVWYFLEFAFMFLQEAAMAKVSASETATFVAHQVRVGWNLLEKAADSLGTKALEPR